MTKTNTEHNEDIHQCSARVSIENYQKTNTLDVLPQQQKEKSKFTKLFEKLVCKPNVYEYIEE